LEIKYVDNAYENCFFCPVCYADLGNLPVIDPQSAERYIREWIQNFLSVENPGLDGWAPCPYAHMARWSVRVGTDDLMDDMISIADSWNDQYDVVILAYDPRRQDPVQFTDTVDAANYHLLAPVNLVALEDHPDAPETVNGVIFNNQFFALVMIQPYDKLAQATRMLKRTDYYARWPKDYYDRVVGFRDELAHRVTNQARGKDEGYWS
jgi:hypothetical protein